ncbi:DUF5906 domain-containing protein [Phenylobacterium sp. LjRoot225]|uniref:primase-helicase family protein n=1 Tax=Phenylobacterium sp. LjRoot225 TaxID=3342285 RepID=UPI003ECEDA3C
MNAPLDGGFSRPRHADSLDMAFPIGPALEQFLAEAAKAAGPNAPMRRAGLRRWVFEEPVGSYRRTVAAVRLSPDGLLKCRGVPAPENAAAIEAEFAEVAKAWKKPIVARNIDDLLPKLRGRIFECRTADGDGIICVQERLEEPKRYLIWTQFSDGNWYEAEPDDGLPLYGLDKLSSGRPVMLHEGPKAAEAVTKLLAEGQEHPWAQALGDYAHLGWMGGAERPEATDWGSIRNLSPDREVVIVADNDAVGVGALSVISRRLGRRLSAVIFDDDFPKTFDLADPWPDHEKWWRDKRYRGPTLEDLMNPATWATTKLPPTKEKGRPAHKIRDEFASEWVWALEPPVFVHRDQPDRLLSAETFNRRVRPFSDVEDTARLLALRAASQVDTIAYQPYSGRARAHVMNVDGRRVVNTFRPPRIAATEGDPAPFLDYMQHLIPDERDRHEALRWITTLIARPEIRMRYSLLLISETQGVGKTTLGEAILAPLVGPWNTSFPSEQMVVDSSFNGWQVHKRLVVVGEIYSGHNRKAYDKLKSVVTDGIMRVNKKYLPEYDIEICCVVVASSNSMQALYLDDEDRRWLVPRVTEETRPAEWWRAFYGWLNQGGGLGIIRAWAEEFVKDPANVVGTGDHAPMTSLKAEIIRESRSPGSQLAYDLGESVAEAADEGKKIVLIVDDVRRWVASQRELDVNNYRMERATTISKALCEAGLRKPERDPEKTEQRVKINGVYQYVVANFVVGPGTTWGRLKEYHKTAEELSKM